MRTVKQKHELLRKADITKQGPGVEGAHGTAGVSIKRGGTMRKKGDGVSSPIGVPQQVDPNMRHLINEVTGTVGGQSMMFEQPSQVMQTQETHVMLSEEEEEEDEDSDPEVAA